MTSGAPGRLVFRSTGARVGGWVWLVFAVANLVDVAIRGRDSAAVIAAAVLLLGCGIAYVIGLRPRVEADETGLRVHNPLRDVVVPWPALLEITAPDSLLIAYIGPDGERHQTRSWVLQTSPRARAKAERRAARTPEDKIGRYLQDRTPADFAAEQLTELARAHRPTGAASTGKTRTSTAPTGKAPAGKVSSGKALPDKAGAGSGEEPAGRLVWWPPAVLALVGPAVLLIGVVLAVSLS
ncbi:PH domain-containing protein [Actinomadura scrupuli]|uniref:PH domain-containing protein n=1 Tax=Actinomadura scrupuli TaxID=559629 RepID=UPI003D970784